MPVITVITNTFRKRWRPARAEPAVPVLVFPGPARVAETRGLSLNQLVHHSTLPEV